MNSKTISASPKAKTPSVSIEVDGIPRKNGGKQSAQNGKSRAASQLRGETAEAIFQLDAPSAREVLLAAGFTDWEKAPVKMSKDRGGVWHAKILLEPGRYRYRFLVDGEWRTDPNRVECVPNPFGTSDSVIEV